MLITRRMKFTKTAHAQRIWDVLKSVNLNQVADERVKGLLKHALAQLLKRGDAMNRISNRKIITSFGFWMVAMSANFGLAQAMGWFTVNADTWVLFGLAALTYLGVLNILRFNKAVGASVMLGIIVGWIYSSNMYDLTMAQIQRGSLLTFCGLLVLNLTLYLLNRQGKLAR